MNYQKKGLYCLLSACFIFLGISLFILKQGEDLKAQLVPLEGQQSQKIYATDRLLFLEGEPGAFAPMKWAVIRDDQAYPIDSQFSLTKAAFEANPVFQNLRKTDPEYIKQLPNKNFITNDDYSLFFNIPSLNGEPQAKVIFTFLDRTNHEILTKEIVLGEALINGHDLRISSVHPRIIGNQFYALVSGYSTQGLDYLIYHLDLSQPDAVFQPLDLSVDDKDELLQENWQFWNDYTYDEIAKNASFQAPFVSLNQANNGQELNFKYFDLDDQKWQEDSIKLGEKDQEIRLLAANKDQLFFLIAQEQAGKLISYDLKAKKLSAPYSFDEAMQESITDYFGMEVAEVEDDGRCQLFTANQQVAQVDLKNGQVDFLGQYQFKEAYQDYLSMRIY